MNIFLNVFKITFMRVYPLLITEMHLEETLGEKITHSYNLPKQPQSTVYLSNLYLACFI